MNNTDYIIFIYYKKKMYFWVGKNMYILCVLVNNKGNNRRSQSFSSNGKRKPKLYGETQEMKFCTKTKRRNHIIYGQKEC